MTDARPVARPAHLHPGLIAAVVVGGAAGTALRLAVVDVIHAPDGFPVATFLVNVAGAFALGLLLGVLRSAGQDAGRPRIARLLLGTGFLGGLTTYSQLALDTVDLLRGGGAAAGLGYAALTLALGVAAAAGGLAVGRSRRPRPRRPR